MAGGEQLRLLGRRTADLGPELMQLWRWVEQAVGPTLANGANPRKTLHHARIVHQISASGRALVFRGFGSDAEVLILGSNSHTPLRGAAQARRPPSPLCIARMLVTNTDYCPCMREQMRERARWIATWVLPVEPALRSWLRHKISSINGLEIDDVVQETYAIMGEISSIDHIHSPRNYVFQTAHSIILAHHRRRKIVPIDYIADLDSLPSADPAPSPEMEVSGREELLRLGELLMELPPRQREAFRLLKLESLSQRQAAMRMGVSESTLEKHVAKAILFLMDRLGRSGRHEPRASSKVRSIVRMVGDATGNQR